MGTFIGEDIPIPSVHKVIKNDEVSFVHRPKPC